MTIMPGGPMDPNAYAAQYARENNISIDDAKQQLRAKYGDPTPPQNFMQAGFKTYYQPQITEPMQAPTAPPPPPQPPVKPLAPKATDLTVTTPEQKLGEEYKIPPEVIEKGDDAIRKFAQEHNIILPAKTSTSTATATTSADLVQNSASSISEDIQTSTEKLSRKEAKKWIKNYQKEHNCSKSEAKKAFERTFGYKVPSSKIQRLGKGLLLIAMSPIALPLGLIDTAAKGNLGFNKAINNFLDG